MDVHAELTAPCTPEELFGWVDDLARYPAWTTLVHRVEAVDADPDDAPAWSVELRARVGPMARSKRLRMVRTVHDRPNAAVFERRELDAKRHSPWILTVELEALGEDCALRVDLHYGGALWTGGLLERALADQIEHGRDALHRLVTDARHSR